MVWKKIILFCNFLGQLLSNFLSKFSFQIRAISSGTAVPGTAMSTVQEVKADADQITAADATKALSNLLQEIYQVIGDKNITTNALDGDTNANVVEDIQSTLNADSTIKDLLAQQAINADDNTVVKVSGLTLKVERASSPISNNITADVEDSKWNVKLVLTGTTDADPNPITVTKDGASVPVDIYTAEKIQAAAGFDSLEIPSVDLTETQMDKWEESAVNDYVTDNYLQPALESTLKALGLYDNLTVGSEEISIDVDGTINDDQTQWNGNVTVYNAFAAATQTKAPEAATVSVGLTSSESNVTTQLKNVIAYLQEHQIKIPFGYEDLKVNANVPSNVIVDVIDPAIENAEKQLEISDVKDMNVSGLKVNADGTALEGVLTKDNSRVSFTIPVQIVSIDSLTVITQPSDIDHVIGTDSNFKEDGMRVAVELSTGSTVTITYNGDNDETDDAATPDNAAATNKDVRNGLTSGDYIAIADADLSGKLALKQLGSVNVTLQAKGIGSATAEVATNVVSRITFDDYAGFDPVKAESDAPEVATAVIRSTDTVITGRKAGKAILTLTDKNANILRINVEVKDNGVIIAKVADAMDPVYITLYDTTNGFKVDTSIDPYVVEGSEDYFSAEYVTYNDKVALKITPKKVGGNYNPGSGEADWAKQANVIVYGADKKLAAGYQVAVTDAGVQKRFVRNNIGTISFDSKAQESIENTIFYKSAGDVTADVTGTVKFRETDKMTITPISSGNFDSWKVKTGEVTLAASEVSSLTLTASDTTGTVTAEYLGKALENQVTVDNVFQTASVSQSALLKNLYLSTGKITVSDPTVASAEFDANGNLVVKPLKESKKASVKITLNDDYIVGEIYFKFSDDGHSVSLDTNNKADDDGNKDGFKIVSNALEDYQDGVYTPPSKTEYYIGEALDVSDAKYEYIKDGKLVTLQMTPNMFSGFDSSKVTEENRPLIVTMTYGGIDAGANKDIKVTIKARTQTVTADDIALVGADITDVIYKGDNGITATMADGNIALTATKTSQSGTMTVTASDGRVVDIAVSINEKGAFTVGAIPFEMHSVTVTKEELDLTPYEAVADDTDLVNVSVADEKVLIESKAEGTTTVTVSDHDGHKATITVVIAKDGSITYTVSPYVDAGWVDLGNGDWGYIQDGERVVSRWVSVVEEDPYNNNEVGEVWYHFGADGKMQRGWISDPEAEWKIYLLDSNGRMMHSDWVNAPEQKELNRPAGIYHLTSDGAVQLNGWALAKGSDSVYWYCNAGNGLFEQDNPASWANEKLW